MSNVCAKMRLQFTYKKLKKILSSKHDITFDMNDVFSIINVVLTITLIAYGFLNKSLMSGLCFGVVSIGLYLICCYCCLSHNFFEECHDYCKFQPSLT